MILAILGRACKYEDEKRKKFRLSLFKRTLIFCLFLDCLFIELILLALILSASGHINIKHWTR
jgi:cell division protein FtsL